MYDMLQAKVDWPGQLISSKNNPKNGLFSKRKYTVYSVLNSPILGLKSHSDWSFDQILAWHKILFLEMPFPYVTTAGSEILQDISSFKDG